MRRRSRPSPTGHPVYLEWLRLGDHLRVAAICSRTGVEVSVVGPAKASRSDLETLALAKLQRKLTGKGTLQRLAEQGSRASKMTDRGRII